MSVAGLLAIKRDLEAFSRWEADQYASVTAKLAEIAAALSEVKAELTSEHDDPGRGNLTQEVGNAKPAETASSSLGSQKPSLNPNNRGEMSPGVRPPSAHPTSPFPDDSGGP